MQFNFRGRTWTAWYAEQIPIDAGPWKLHGLPGLILKSTDNSATHDFEAIIVRKPCTPNIKQNVRKRLETVTRQNFREQEYETAVNIGSVMGELVEEMPNSAKRWFYSPLELEQKRESTHHTE